MHASVLRDCSQQCPEQRTQGLSTLSPLNYLKAIYELLKPKQHGINCSLPPKYLQGFPTLPVNFLGSSIPLRCGPIQHLRDLFHPGLGFP